jgi:hypothetical protein
MGFEDSKCVHWLWWGELRGTLTSIVPKRRRTDASRGQFSGSELQDKNLILHLCFLLVLRSAIVLKLEGLLNSSLLVLE